MRLQTKPDESTNQTKIPFAPQATVKSPAVQAEALSEQSEPIKTSREKVASPKPLGTRVAVVLASCAAVFSAAALWQAPAATRFTPSGFIEGATRATEMVWYENVRIELAKKNLEAGRAKTAAQLLIPSLPTQLHNDVEIAALRKKALVAACQQGAMAEAVQLASLKPVLQTGAWEDRDAFDLFWAESARSGRYAEARKVVSALSKEKKEVFLETLTVNLTRKYNSIYGLGSATYSELMVDLSLDELREWRRLYPNNRILKLKELAALRGTVPVPELLARIDRLDREAVASKSGETASSHGLKLLLVADVLKAQGFDAALAQYRNLFPGDSLVTRAGFVSGLYSYLPPQRVLEEIRSSLVPLTSKINEPLSGTTPSWTDDSVGLMIGQYLSTLVQVKVDRNSQEYQELSRSLTDLDNRRKQFLLRKYPKIK